MNSTIRLSKPTQDLAKTKRSSAWLHADWSQSTLNLTVGGEHCIPDDRVQRLAASFASIEPLTTTGPVDNDKETKQPAAEQTTAPSASTSSRGECIIAEDGEETTNPPGPEGEDIEAE